MENKKTVLSIYITFFCIVGKGRNPYDKSTTSQRKKITAAAILRRKIRAENDFLHVVL